MTFPTFLLGLLLAVVTWPGQIDGFTMPRWALLSVGIPVCLLFARDTGLVSWRAVVAFLVAGSSALWAANTINAIDELAHAIILLMAFWLGSSMNPRPLWFGIGLGVTVSAILATFQVMGWSGIEQAAPPGGLFSNRNILAEAGMIAVVTAIAMQAWWLLPGALIAILLGGSKAALMAIVVALTWWAWPRLSLAIGALGLCLIGGIFLLIEHPSAMERLDIWDAALEHLTFFGSGLGSYAATFPKYEFAHLEYLQALFEMGVLSIPLFWLLLYSLNGPRDENFMVLATIAVVGLFSFPFHMPLTAFAAAVAAGHLVARRAGVHFDESALGFLGSKGPQWATALPLRDRGLAGSIFGRVSSAAPRCITRWTQTSPEGVVRTRAFTRDDATTHDLRSRFYTTERLGPKQSLTPEGFLLCEEVPIARTGTMEYGPNETPIPVGQDGIVRISRDADEVFRPEFILSFNGKPVVDDHPPEDVRPENWKRYSHGVVMNVRRGTGDLSEFLLGDLIICDADLINSVRAGKREVSCGYDADYEETSPGHGRQYKMIGNHVALVESGRCGPRCAIGDRKPTGDCSMPATSGKLKRVFDRIRRAAKAKDEGELEDVLQDAQTQLETDAGAGDPGREDETHLHVHAGGDALPASGSRGMTDEDIEGRFGALESSLQGIHDSLEELKGNKPNPTDADPSAVQIEVASGDAMAEEAPAGTAKDAVMKARDSSLFQDSFQETLSLAEILVPGIHIPTFDRAAQPKKTFDTICGLRRQAIDLAYHQVDSRAIIDQLNGYKPLELTKMSCHDMRTLFRAAAAMKKASNGTSSRDTTSATRTSGGGLGVVGGVKNLAELNALNAKHYGVR